MILSHGPNGFGAWLPRSGIQNPLPTGPDEAANTDNDLVFIQKGYAENPTNPYDDVPTWLSAEDLLTPLIRGGTLQSARAVTNDRIRTAQDALLGACRT